MTRKRRIYQLCKLADIPAKQALVVLQSEGFLYKTISDQVSLSDLEKVTSLLISADKRKQESQNTPKNNIVLLKNNLLLLLEEPKSKDASKKSITSILVEHAKQKQQSQIPRKENLRQEKPSPYRKKQQRNNRNGPAPKLSDNELLIRILRPLYEKGKNGRNHTTPIESLFCHGIPDHQKEEAKALVQKWLTEGVLAEKQSKGHQHVWLTAEGRKLISKELMLE